MNGHRAVGLDTPGLFSRGLGSFECSPQPATPLSWYRDWKVPGTEQVVQPAPECHMNPKRAASGSRRSCQARRGNAIAEFALIESPSFPLSRVRFPARRLIMRNHTEEQETKAAGSEPDPRSPRNRRRSGNTALEFAFTMMPTFALIAIFLDLG